MENTDFDRRILRETLKTLALQHGVYRVPAAVSNRHVHLCESRFRMLFGDEAHLTPLRSLVQPDQFVSIHEVILEGPKGSIPRVKILGPFRKQTQVEISITDARRLGVPPVIRLSGDLAGTPGCTLRGPCGTILLDEGVIVAARHLHLSTDDAACYKLRSGQVVQVATTGQRAAILDGIIVRVGDDQALELHLDCDEVNAAGIRGGDLLELRPSP